ncbi:hypothetical protein M422DRAFT_250612 [Sphaerobolus stellatus SS14]|uniref:Uncharacterized protein n=1 Tax=Sphaerobolus stellatus (strain SS14) TaxID=990650 RepID=A0A0C9VTB9_SPHS4|nr:hypothetical protein M422DRAFT_250612 [Sphaerobolus stellatus SS14]
MANEKRSTVACASLRVSKQLFSFPLRSSDRSLIAFLLIASAMNSLEWGLTMAGLNNIANLEMEMNKRRIDQDKLPKKSKWRSSLREVVLPTITSTSRHALSIQMVLETLAMPIQSVPVL